MSRVRLCRHEVSLLPEAARVILRPFIPGSPEQISRILARALTIAEGEVRSELEVVLREFEGRHLDMRAALQRHARAVSHHLAPGHEISEARELLIGALFSGEYALESAAIFNPSIVPHPDQSAVPPGSLRFIMSLRATGEGHISSIEFRTGIIGHDSSIALDPVSRFVSAPEVLPNPAYGRRPFALKLAEMGFGDAFADRILAPLGDTFTRRDLERRMAVAAAEFSEDDRSLHRALEGIAWLADCNYELRFDESLAMSERIIFPVAPSESNGIEDARFVRFLDTDGTVTYYATYTAYNGRAVMSQLIETRDFLHFRIRTLNGSAVGNKGMALFPRRIQGRYAMLSRQDDANLFLMFSDTPDNWNDPRLILSPSQMWESVKIGNCGSPIETAAGWLVLTHGVGPMRKYCIGAVLLDLEDPTRVLGRLREPLLSPAGNEREGYVPNVVYSCGSLLHRRDLILPFAVSDRASAIASVRLDDLLAAMR